MVPSDSKAIVPTIQQARDAGLLVIVLDTPLDPIDAADATFATDNFKAGELIGALGARTLGDKAKDAKIAFLDLATNQPTVDYLRDQGFMKGFGIDIKDPKQYGDENDPRVVATTSARATRRRGARRWRTCCRRTRISMSSTRSTNPPLPAPGRR